jgi:hypothetical protein
MQEPGQGWKSRGGDAAGAVGTARWNDQGFRRYVNDTCSPARVIRNT